MRAKLVATSCDCMGYTTYVFEDLEYRDYDYKYIMCVRFPNWNQSPISINDIGFVTVRYVQAGIDKWYNGDSFDTYKYTNIIFMKFINEKPMIDNLEINVD